MFIDEDIKCLMDDIEVNFSRWRQHRYEFVNVENGTKIWTANGPPFVAINNYKGLGFFEKRAIWKSIKRANACNAIL